MLIFYPYGSGTHPKGCPYYRQHHSHRDLTRGSKKFCHVPRNQLTK